PQTFASHHADNTHTMNSCLNLLSPLNDSCSLSSSSWNTACVRRSHDPPPRTRLSRPASFVLSYSTPACYSPPHAKGKINRLLLPNVSGIATRTPYVDP